MDYHDFDLTAYQFVDESSWWTRFTHNLAGRFNTLTGIVPVVSPVRNPRRFNLTDPPITRLGQAIGFNTPADYAALTHHRKRVYYRVYIALGLYTLLLLPLIPLLIWVLQSILLGYTNLTQQLALPPSMNFTLAYLFIPTTLLLLSAIVSTALKVASVLSDRYYADSICVATAIFLVIQLTRDDVLSNPRRKRDLLDRMHYLANCTLLLTSSFGVKDPAAEAWLKEHFGQIEQYIRERQRWVVSPIDLTLKDLRRDFHKLAKMYIDSSYGSFEWPTDAPTTPPAIVSTSLLRRAWLALPRILGLLLPLVLLGFLIWNPAALQVIGVDVNIVALLFFVWLLITLDTILKLGIVDRVVSLAKDVSSLK